MKVEPSAELRQMANFWWQTFVALRDAGFTEAQALRIIGYTMQIPLSEDE